MFEWLKSQEWSTPIYHVYEHISFLKSHPFAGILKTYTGLDLWEYIQWSKKETFSPETGPEFPQNDKNGANPISYFFGGRY